MTAKLKLLPLAIILHKFRNYRVILDLLFLLKLPGYNLLSFNGATGTCALEDTIGQISSVLPQLIESLAMAPKECGNILISKLDIKDGF